MGLPVRGKSLVAKEVKGIRESRNKEELFLSSPSKRTKDFLVIVGEGVHEKMIEMGVKAKEGITTCRGW